MSIGASGVSWRGVVWIVLRAALEFEWSGAFRVGVSGDLGAEWRRGEERAFFLVDEMVASVDDGFPREHRRKDNKLFHDNVHRNVYIDSVSLRLVCVCGGEWSGVRFWIFVVAYELLDFGEVICRLRNFDGFFFCSEFV